jgi:hypothetical protein
VPPLAVLLRQLRGGGGFLLQALPPLLLARALNLGRQQLRVFPADALDTLVRAGGVSPRAQALAVVDARVVESLRVDGWGVIRGERQNGRRKRFASRDRLEGEKGGKKTPAIFVFPLRFSVLRFPKVA